MSDKPEVNPITRKVKAFRLNDNEIDMLDELAKFEVMSGGEVVRMLIRDRYKELFLA